MTKAKELDALARGEGCIGKSRDDEPIFTLVARDKHAAGVVREWARRFRQQKVETNAFDERAREKYQEALDLANQMDQWRYDNGGGKWPD